MAGAYLVDVQRGDELRRYVAETEQEIAELLKPRKGAVPLEYLRIERVRSAAAATAEARR